MKADRMEACMGIKRHAEEEEEDESEEEEEEVV